MVLSELEDFSLLLVVVVLKVVGAAMSLLNTLEEKGERSLDSIWMRKASMSMSIPSSSSLFELEGSLEEEEVMVSSLG